jgi:hypothetical protein
MRVLLSHESGCARSFLTRCAIGRNLARPFVIDVSASSASQLAAGPTVQPSVDVFEFQGCTFSCLQHFVM